MTPDPFPPDDANVVDPLVLAERRAQRAELAEQVAGRRATDAQSLAAELSADRARLEAELEQARREPERLSRLVAERERALRVAEHRAHAEEAQRIEAVDELGERTRRHEAELTALRDELARARADADRERGELETRTAEVEAAAARELEARVAQAEAESARELAELEARVARAEADAERAEGALTERAARAREEAQRAEAATAEQRTRAQADAERAEAALTERLGELQQRVERAEATAMRSQKELDALRGQLSEAEQIASSAETARKRAEAKRVASRDKRRRALEARDTARLEADAAREGADAVMAEAAHAQAERDALRAGLEQAQAERDALRTELEQAQAPRDVTHAVAPAGMDSGMPELAESAPPAVHAPVQDWSAGLRAELAVARAAAARPLAAAVASGWSGGLDGVSREISAGAAAGASTATSSGAAAAAGGSAPAPSAPRVFVGALERERRLVAQRAARTQLSARSQPAPRVGAAERIPAQAGEAAMAESRRVAARAMPVTALALERERSVRLQAQLDRQAATERALRGQVEALEQAVQARVDAEARIEGALRRVRGELEAANALRALTAQVPPRTQSPAVDPATPVEPADAATEPPATAPLDWPMSAAPLAAVPTGPSAAEPAPGPSAAELAAALEAARAERLAAAIAAAAASEATAQPEEPAAEAPSDPEPAAPEAPALVLDTELAPHDQPGGLEAGRLTAARARLRASVPPSDDARAAVEQLVPTAAKGPPSPWLPNALRRLVRDDPDTVGRILVGMLPAQGLVTQRAFSYDVVLADRGTVAVDVRGGAAAVRATDGPRPQKELDVRIATTHEGLGRLLAGRRGLRRRARVRGKHRRVRELRRLAREPLALRDLSSAGAVLEPALAFWLAALAIDPAQTQGHRFTIAHAPLPGGPPDAWLRIQHGGSLSVMRTKPGEEPAVTLRCTRGALLALLAGVTPPPGEGAAVDGDLEALELVRGWIARTEFPGA